MNRKTCYRTRWCALCVAAMAVMPGCMTIDVDGKSGDPNKVVVRLFNDSWTLTVEPFLYATGQPVTDATTELFIPANAVPSIGAAGRGIIGPRGDDKVTLDCSQAWALGTPGASFLDGDGNVQGTSQQVVLIQGQGVLECGKTITFTFRDKSGGIFETNVSTSAQ